MLKSSRKLFDRTKSSSFNLVLVQDSSNGKVKRNNYILYEQKNTDKLRVIYSRVSLSKD